MHILVFEQRYTRPSEPGIARYAYFSKVWGEGGHKVTIISGMTDYVTGKKPSLYRSTFFVREHEAQNVEVLRVFDSSLGYRTFFGRMWSYITFFFSALIAGFFVSRPSVVIASSPPISIGLIGFFVGFFRRVPFVFEVRDPWPDAAIHLGFLRNPLLIRFSLWLERFLYRSAKLIVVNSPGLKEFLLKDKHVPEEHVVVISNPLDISLFSYFAEDIRKKNSWGKKFVVLYAGSHSAVYNLMVLIDAADELKRGNFLFVLIGDGRQKPQLVERVKTLRLQNVLFFNPIPKDQVPIYIQAADACVVSLSSMPLLKYVYATKVFDYMAGGKPVLVAMEGVTAHLVCKEAECGICMKPGDSKAFIGALQYLQGHTRTCKALGDRGKRYARKHFDYNVLALEYARCLDRVFHT